MHNTIDEVDRLKQLLNDVIFEAAASGLSL